MADEKNIIWVVSNRVDDRVVLWERDPAHPGGEAFVGGSAPAPVSKTSGEVQRLLRDGLLLEIPEPPDGPKKPRLDLLDAGVAETVAAQPGQVVRLGRPLDPDLVPKGAMERLQEKQADLPQEVPVPTGVEQPPPVEEPTRERTRR